ncbi:hypothetical protein CAEBREN_04624 [Caenorhabditis brenneri]|uniref:Uncharacterized protein n=1 Tax=Caenorhabditis brenneri TaxID=135651 RepID=G0P9M0_CAEBE|nr:hypothetical protein CAEBREN_04624 [Caenorhabditis brenneri]
MVQATQPSLPQEPLTFFSPTRKLHMMQQALLSKSSTPLQPGTPEFEKLFTEALEYAKNNPNYEDRKIDLSALALTHRFGYNAIANYLDPTKRNERNMNVPKILTAPTGSIIHRLEGLPEWTQEIDGDYGAIFEDYGKLQFEMEYSLELVIPSVLTAEEQVKKRAEAVEHENNCALYKDPQQSIRSSLFNQHKPGFPQGVWNTATVWLLFKTFHTNSGVKNDQGLLDKMWDEIREEKGLEFWGWIKRASDLKDEQLQQRELGFVVKNVAKERKSRRATGG